MIQKEKQVESKAKLIKERRNTTQNIISGIDYFFADFFPLEIALDNNWSARKVTRASK